VGLSGDGPSTIGARDTKHTTADAEPEPGNPRALTVRRLGVVGYQAGIALQERLVEERNAVVLVLGSESEAAPDRGRLTGLPRGRVHDLAGATRLAEAAALIAGCDLFVGNDSGLLHMALAANVAAVAVFGATPPAQVLHTSTNAVAVVADFPCQPCYRHQPLFDYRCNYGFRCLRELPVSAVLNEVLRRAPNRF